MWCFTNGMGVFSQGKGGFYLFIYFCLEQLQEICNQDEKFARGGKKSRLFFLQAVF